MAVNPLPNVSALSLESCKMDIVSCDIYVFTSHKHPAEAIKSFYFNAYNHLIQVLSPHCSAIKMVTNSNVSYHPALMHCYSIRAHSLVWG